MGIEEYELLLKEIMLSDEYIQDALKELKNLEEVKNYYKENHLGAHPGLYTRIHELEDSLNNMISLIPLVELYAANVEDEEKKDELVRFFTSEKILHTVYCDLKINPKTLRVFQRQFDFISHLYDKYGKDYIALLETRYRLGYMEDIMFSSQYTDYYLANMAEDVAFKSLFEIFSIYGDDIDSRERVTNEYMDLDNRIYVNKIISNPNLTGVLDRDGRILSPKEIIEQKKYYI